MAHRTKVPTQVTFRLTYLFLLDSQYVLTNAKNATGAPKREREKKGDSGPKISALTTLAEEQPMRKLYSSKTLYPMVVRSGNAWF